jgi:hypothetical protein
MGQGYRQILGIILAVILVVQAVAAAPVTGAATLIGPRNVTVSAAGVTTEGWFLYGETCGHESWSTSTVTEVGGNIEITITGNPLYPQVQYCYKACDATGCGASLTFTMPTPTPIPQTTLGRMLTNMTQSHLNPVYASTWILDPYTWVSPIAVVVGLTLFAYYFGLWWRNRGTAIPAIVGIITGGFMIYGTSGLRLGVPVEFVMVAEGILYASIAGLLLSLIKRG